MSDRMPTTRRSSGGRHRAPDAPTSRRPRLVPGVVVKGAIALALAASMGGYTVAESATQRAAAAVVQQARVEAREQAEAARQAVAADRQRAVATAQDALADAGAVQAVAASAVTQADLVPLTEAVDALTSLLGEVPGTGVTAGGVPAAVVDRSARASRSAVERPEIEPLDTPTPDAPTSDAPAPDAAAPDAAASDAPASDAQAQDVPAPDDALTDAPTPDAGTAPVEPDEAAQVEADAADQPDEAQAPSPAASGAPGAAPAEETGDGGLDDATDAPAPADDAAPEDALSADILAAVARVSEVAAQVQATADANLAAQQAAAAAAEAAARAAAEAAAQAAAEAAAQAAAEVAEKEAQRVSLDAYPNGQIPAEALCDLAVGTGHQLRCDAADALAELDAAYAAEFGGHLTISDSYRSYSAQVACVRVKGGLCAKPGTSNHGRGVAVDLAGGVQTFGTRQHRWMAANGPSFGWTLPDWASAGGSKPEPWHWEFTG